MSIDGMELMEGEKFRGRVENAKDRFPPRQNDRLAFVLFSKLAVELRLEIWRYAFLDRVPQFVAVSTFRHDCKGHENEWCPRYTSNPPPSLVNVCIEARQIAYEEAAKTNQLHFISKPSSFNASCCPGIIFNPLTDILYIPSSDKMWNLFCETGGILAQVHSTPILNTTRRLALNIVTHGLSVRLRDMGIIRSLKEIIFVAPQIGDHEQLAIAIAMGYLQRMRERRRTRAGSYGEVPDRGNYPSVRFGLRSEESVEVFNLSDTAVPGRKIDIADI